MMKVKNTGLCLLPFAFKYNCYCFKKKLNGKYDLKIMAITFYGLGYIFFTSRTFTKNKKVTF